ncbi:uncharacterized protein LOC130628675 [Hydractinia symbiolongicarpus]|uniref:uncharacterized protein LOC130628675 n=1 Tax=Hydractinia symbiolongicarpus TaxID=13093 RepID=UPI00254EBF73|nr:uncharacterized protein LOC130628675 [Hydractinia symbiolongicarpus]
MELFIIEGVIQNIKSGRSMVPRVPLVFFEFGNRHGTYTQSVQGVMEKLVATCRGRAVNGKIQLRRPEAERKDATAVGPDQTVLRIEIMNGLNKKWIIISIYRPPSYLNLTQFFYELEKILNNALSKCDNIIVLGDINIDFYNPSDSGYGQMQSLCDIFNLKNLIKDKACFAGTEGSSIDVLLTNRYRSFQNSSAFETGLSDHHLMITTFLKMHLARLQPKKIFYRNYKNFDEKTFLADVKAANFCCDTADPDLNYENLQVIFRNIVDKHAPLKQKTLRGNDAPFMNKELRKAIYSRSRFKNKYNNDKTEENNANYKRQRNKCVKLRNIAVKEYFKKITQAGAVENKNFWKVMKPFVTNKNCLSNANITIIQNDNLITDENEVATTLNSHFINIVENSSGDEEIKKVFKEINTKASAGEDKIPPKLAKLASEHLILPLKNALNSSIRASFFPTKAKRAVVTPIDKGSKEKYSLNNFRPISVLNFFSKFYEIIIKEQILSFMEKKLSVYLSAYRKNYSTNHVLIRLLEDWKKKLDRNYVVGSILMDLSKAFDCVPHDLLIAKLHAYGFDVKSLEYILSYLTNREQSTRVNAEYSIFELILSGVPQGSVDLHNYADDNTISAYSNTIKNLIKTLERESEIALSWLNNNKMIASPNKFHSILLSRAKIDNSKLEINIGDRVIQSERSVKLLGVTIDDKLNFNLHISNLCRKASAQLNALFRFKNVLSLQTRSILAQSFVKKYYVKGDYDSFYKTDVYQRLRLVCPQLDEDDCLLDGKKSKNLAVLPTKENAWGDMLTWTFNKPVYLPLKGSTDRLEFMLTDEYHHEKNISFVGIKIHLLIE